MQEIVEEGREIFGEDPLLSLRQRVLHVTLNVLALSVPILTGVMVLSVVRRGVLHPPLLVFSSHALLYPVLRFASQRLGFVRTASSLLGLLLLTACFLEARGGVAVGSNSLNLLALLLSALFFGRRGAALTLFGVLLLFGVAGTILLGGLVPPAQPLLWNPMTASFWLRQGVAVAVFSLAVVVIEVYVVERLAREAKRLRSLAEQEQQQRLALERSERERAREREKRLEAQQALQESRRIEALARLAGGIAHDFNNALTVIVGSADLLESGALDPAEIKVYAAEITTAAQGAGELIRQLLTLGRRQVSKPAPVRLAELLERVRNALRRVLPSDVSLALTAPAEDVLVHVDPGQLERALFNLAINARDAMPRGGTLRLESRCEALDSDRDGMQAGTYVALTISDTGEGMPPETLERIFEPFFTTKLPGVGTGLGLATVYAFAQESGGCIRVSSSLGVGTTFTLLLPGAIEVAKAAPVAASPRDQVPHERHNVPVLVVEDRADVRATMVRTLELGGFDVTAAGDGDRALSVLAERSDFAVLCIDGVMPGASTSSVIDRAQQLAPGMCVLVCSGYLNEDLVRRNVAVGRYDFLQKPFSPDQLLASVRRLL